MNDTGIITAKSEGTATITVRSVNGKTASCRITVEKEKEDHTHTYENTWKSDEDNHWKECECGNKSEFAPHDFVWESDGEALTEGSRHEVCSVCGYIGNIGEGGESEDEGNAGEGGESEDEENIVENFDGSISSDGSVENEIYFEPWMPETPYEWKRYECMGNETIEYTLAEDNAYILVIEKAMQGELCFNVFEAVKNDYTIGRTYNIYPYPEKVYSMDEEVQFTIKIPEAVYEPNRKYKMICVSKNGFPIIYDDLDNNSKTITVRTNRFSAYALIYK